MKRLLIVATVTSLLCVPVYFGFFHGYTGVYTTGYAAGYEDASRVVPNVYRAGYADGYQHGFEDRTNSVPFDAELP